MRTLWLLCTLFHRVAWSGELASEHAESFHVRGGDEQEGAESLVFLHHYPFPRGGAGMPRAMPPPPTPSNQCTEGLCLPRTTCLATGGITSGICSGGNTVCCNFESTCRRVTKDVQTFWTSPGYPAPTVGTLLCQFDIIVQPGICGIRLDFKEFNTTRPLDRGLCHIDQFLILNSLDGAAFARCGELSGYSTIVPVDARQHLPLSLLSLIQSSQETYKWNIKITQMKCEETRRIADYPGCGKKAGEADVGTTVGSTEVDNEIPDNRFQKNDLSRENIDNYFFIEYLKRAHEALTDGPQANPNLTLCKNTAADIEAEKLKERIIRGHDALLNEFPWQVSIQDRRGHICGGALIDQFNILTAAHCFMSITPVPLTSIKVVLGDLNLNLTTETTHQTVELHSVLFHSHFDPYYLKNDIALIRLSKPVQFRTGIQPVCLPESDNSYAGKQAVISGWGAINFPMGKLATHLQRVENDVIENAECRKILKVEYIFSTMLCAQAPKCAGTCFGDSGGPLVVEDKDGSSRIVGIVSFGIGGCALLPYWPDVYTRVSEFLDWLSYATKWY